MHYGVNISKTEIRWISSHNNEIIAYQSDTLCVCNKIN